MKISVGKYFYFKRYLILKKNKFFLIISNIFLKILNKEIFNLLLLIININLISTLKDEL